MSGTVSVDMSTIPGRFYVTSHTAPVDILPLRLQQFHATNTLELYKSDSVASLHI